MFGNILIEQEIITVIVTGFLGMTKFEKLLTTTKGKTENTKHQCTQAFEIESINLLLKSQSFFPNSWFEANALGLN